MKSLCALFVLFCFLSVPAASDAQWAVSPHVVISIPSNDFANVDQTGGGFGVKVIRQTTALSGALGLRGDFAFLTYGKKTTLVRDALTLNVIPIESRNEGFRLTFGPQYSIGGRGLKFQLGANGGLYFYRTNITARFFNPVAGRRDFLSNSEGNNWALGWNIEGGLQYDIGLGPWLDLALEYQTIHNLPESVEDNTVEDAPPVPDITAHEFTIKIGVIFFLGR